MIKVGDAEKPCETGSSGGTRSSVSSQCSVTYRHTAGPVSSFHQRRGRMSGTSWLRNSLKVALNGVDRPSRSSRKPARALGSASPPGVWAPSGSARGTSRSRRVGPGRRRPVRLRRAMSPSKSIGLKALTASACTSSSSPTHTERGDDNGAQLGGQLALAVLGVPPETGELRVKERAHLVAQDDALVGVEGAVHHVDRRGDHLPGLGSSWSPRPWANVRKSFQVIALASSAARSRRRRWRARSRSGRRVVRRNRGQFRCSRSAIERLPSPPRSRQHGRRVGDGEGSSSSRWREGSPPSSERVSERDQPVFADRAVALLA